ncbi:hypothetical protein DXT99_09490 [Pontibacter diazotrophicus]|uniref:Outer membrane protein beta-barrel domain-containing protein n=1 Tax=Pontibacter diazotrophicus TaxID=1400979 RepID=A0A3D8LD65_9BACT|nr:hypothetical protein [Pontibacter diazotrophicus]RDV15293.1 hypothetical protein DXT99_09490 [Pontibacter diazotrophicus]
MKKLFFTVLFIAALHFQVRAQSETPGRYNKAIFVEALGNGIGISANYDMRIKRGVQDGFGFRAGIGGLSANGTDTDGRSVDASIITFPLAVNYLIGERRSAFEAGLGITPIYANADVYDTNNTGITDAKGWGTSGFINLGYRFQPLKNGFVFRFDWTPAFNSTGFSPAWFGISAGIGFK